MSDKAKTEAHVHWRAYDTDDNPTTGTANRPHAIAHPPEGIKPMPLKGTKALSPSGRLNTRFIELFKDKTALPVYRFTTDATPRLRNREGTPSGVTPGDGIFMEVLTDDDDFILMETGTDDYILQEA